MNIHPVEYPNKGKCRVVTAGKRIQRVQRGYTLIELLLVITVLSVLLAVAMPGFQDTIESTTTNSQAKSLLTTLTFARSEAVKRGEVVSVCGSTNGTDCAAASWAQGWIVFIDANGDAAGATGSVDPGDTIIRVYESLGAGSSLTATTNIVQYNSLGFSATNGVQTFLICPGSNNAANARSIEVGLSGRGRRIETGLVCN